MSDEDLPKLPWILSLARRLPIEAARSIAACYGRWRGDPRDRRIVAGGLRMLGSEEASLRLRRVALGHEWSRCMAGEKLAQFTVEQAAKRIETGEHNYIADFRERRAGAVAAVFQLHALDVLQRCAEGEKQLADVVLLPGEAIEDHEHLLDHGKILAMLQEWYSDRAPGIRTPLFGHLAGAATEIAELAFAHAVPVVPLWLRERGGSGWELLQERPILPKGSAAGMTLRLLRRFSAWAEAHPSDVDWLRHPWRPPVSRVLWSRRREKIVLPAGERPESLAPFRVAVRVPGAIREACMAIPAVRALKRGRRDTAITVFGPGPAEPLWKAVQEVDAYATTDDRVGASSGEHFHLAVVLEEDGAAWKTFRAISADRFVGRDRAPSGSRFDDGVTGRVKIGPPEHRTRFYLRTAHRLGAEVQKDPSLFRPVPIRTQGAPSSGPLHLAVAPYSSEGSSYRWPMERYAEVLREISERFGCVWHVFGDEAVRQETTEMHRRIPDVVLKGHHSEEPLDALWSRLASCCAILGSDGHFIHLAGAAGLPGVCLFGPSDPQVYLPWSPGMRAICRHVECSPCSLPQCPLDHRCLEELTAERVVEVMMEVLQELLVGRGVAEHRP
ncbi:MAG TPA: glycosyltransferase family 9 protein [Verrucomicrobiales bacterium]|nr:glycosyltransferase family 9 protein [Verrucomicrobiales bacterium]